MLKIILLFIYTSAILAPTPYDWGRQILFWYLRWNWPWNLWLRATWIISSRIYISRSWTHYHNVRINFSECFSLELEALVAITNSHSWETGFRSSPSGCIATSIELAPLNQWHSYGLSIYCREKNNIIHYLLHVLS